MLDRLHKILARAGVAALRPAEDMILQGRVTVNGRVVRELGARADPDTDVITVDGQLIHVPVASDPHRYFMLHKPVGVISTAHDTHDRPTVLDLVPNNVRVFPVGRLDADSEGLMLLTDDGDLAYRLTHPRFEVDKEYRVLVDHTPDLDTLRRWRSGVELPYGEVTARAWAEVLERSPDGTWLRVVLHEGKKRQIREVARLLGLQVRRLIRVREGPLTLGDLPAGGWRELTRAEVDALRAHTQHVPSREADEERERKISMSEDEEKRPRRLRVVRRSTRGDVSRMPGAQGQEPAAQEQEDAIGAGVAPSWDVIGEEIEQMAPELDEESTGFAPARADFGNARDEQQQEERPERAPAERTRRFEQRPAPSGRDNPRRDDRATSGPTRGYGDDRPAFDRRPRPDQEPGRAPDQRGEQRGFGQRPPQRDDSRGFGQRGERAGFEQRNDRSGSFGQRDDRRSGPGQRDDSRGFGQRGPSQRDDRQNYVERGPSQRDDRPSFRQGPPPRDGARSFDRDRPSGPRDNQRGGFRQDNRGPADRSGPPRGDIRSGTRSGFRDGPPRNDFRSGPPRDGFRSGPPRDDFRGPPRDRQPERFGGDDQRTERRDDVPERGNERDAVERPRGFGDRPRSFGDRPRSFGDRPRGFGGDRSRSSGGPRSFGGGSRSGSGRGFGNRPTDSNRGPDGLPRRESQQGQFRSPPRDEERRGPSDGGTFNRSSGPSSENSGFSRSRSGPPTGRFNSRSSGPSRGGPSRGPRTGITRRPGPPRRRRDEE